MASFLLSPPPVVVVVVSFLCYFAVLRFPSHSGTSTERCVGFFFQPLAVVAGQGDDSPSPNVRPNKASSGSDAVRKSGAGDEPAGGGGSREDGWMDEDIGLKGQYFEQYYQSHLGPLGDLSIRFQADKAKVVENGKVQEKFLCSNSLKYNERFEDGQNFHFRDVELFLKPNSEEVLTLRDVSIAVEPAIVLEGETAKRALSARKDFAGSKDGEEVDEHSKDNGEAGQNPRGSSGQGNWLNSWLPLWMGDSEDTGSQSGSEKAAPAASSAMVDIFTEPDADYSNEVTIMPQEAEEVDSSVQLIYKCKKEGRTRVNVVFHFVEVEQPVCVSWNKVCKFGWGDLQVREYYTQEEVFGDQKVNARWQKTASGGAPDAVVPETQHATAFSLAHSAAGSIRVDSVRVASSDPEAVAVQVFGLPEDYGDSAIDVGGEPGATWPVSVGYKCKAKEASEAVVKLTLSRDVPETPPIEISWLKKCKEVEDKTLQVQLHSCYKNGTIDGTVEGQVAVTQGKVLPLFSTSGSRNHFVVPAGERCSAFSFSSEVNAIREDSFAPPPLVSFDRNVLHVKNVRVAATAIAPEPPATAAEDGAKGGGAKRDGGSSSARRSGSPIGPVSISLNYICIGEGSSTVRASVHNEQLQTLEISWVKACVKPKVRVSTAFTARTGLTLAFALTALLIFGFFCTNTAKIFAFITNPKRFTSLDCLNDCRPAAFDGYLEQPSAVKVGSAVGPSRLGEIRLVSDRENS